MDSTIIKDQVLRTESGRSGRMFSIDYLIEIWAYNKSNTFPVGFLKATAYLDGDGKDSKDTLVITGPVAVKIDKESY